jgi:hypothetical protein
MSLSREETVTCRKCEHLLSVTIWSSVNVALDPGLKDKLFDGSLFSFLCPECETPTYLHYDLLYHDPVHCLMINFIIPDDDGRFGLDPVDDFHHIQDLLGPTALSLPALTLRVVPSWEELVEKIRIFDDGYDDLKMEAMKLVLTSLQNLDPTEDLWYARTEPTPTGDAIVFFVPNPGDYKNVRACHCPAVLLIPSAEALLASWEGADSARSERWAYITRYTLLQQLGEAGILTLPPD